MRLKNRKAHGPHCSDELQLPCFVIYYFLFKLPYVATLRLSWMKKKIHYIPLLFEIENLYNYSRPKTNIFTLRKNNIKVYCSIFLTHVLSYIYMYSIILPLGSYRDKDNKISFNGRRYTGNGSRKATEYHYMDHTVHTLRLSKADPGLAPPPPVLKFLDPPLTITVSLTTRWDPLPTLAPSLVNRSASDGCRLGWRAGVS